MKSFISSILYQPLFNALIVLVFFVPGHNVGLAIIALTVIVRLILLPSSLNASRQQKHMQDLQPQLKALQDKYKGDKAKQAEMLTQFYKENKVNPLGSCLPLLIQMPILIVLYYVFTNGLNTSHFNLLYSYVPRPDYIQTIFLGLDLGKPDKYYILPVIAGLFQFYQGYQMTPKTKPGETPEMAQMISKQMLYMMPIFTVLIAGRFAAALPLYWIVTTLFAIGQQWWINKENPKSDPSRLGLAEAEYRNPKSFDRAQDRQIQNTKSEMKIEKLESKTAKNGVEVTVRHKR